LTAKDQIQKDPGTIPVGSWESKNYRCPPANTKTGSECMTDIRAEIDGDYTGERRKLNKKMYMQQKRRKAKCQK